jgi:hypothetical protein
MVIGELAVGTASALTPGETVFVGVGRTPTGKTGGFNGGGGACGCDTDNCGQPCDIPCGSGGSAGQPGTARQLRGWSITDAHGHVYRFARCDSGPAPR